MWIFALALLTPATITGLRIYNEHQATHTMSCAQLTETLERLDDAEGLPETPILMLGSERLLHWQSPPKELDGRPLLVRSVLGLEPQLIADCFQRTLAFYRPSIAVLVLDKENTLDDPTTTLEQLSDIQAARSYYGMPPSLAVIPPIVTPRDGSGTETIDSFRAQLVAWSLKFPETHVFDMKSALAGSASGVDPAMFWPDGRTLNTEGYKKLELRLSQLLALMDSPRTETGTPVGL